MNYDKDVLLVLETSKADINDGVNCNMTWNNINLKQLLGDLWDEYDYFNLQLAQVFYGNDANIQGPPGLFNMIVINIKGFPITQYYKNKITDTAIIGAFNIFTPQIIKSNTNILTFYKKDIIDINIFYELVQGSHNYSALSQYLRGANRKMFNQTFIFKISGVDIENNINMERRIF
jgi:hypothetical protein